MKHYEYVIIGNSAAAIGAVQGIRQIDSENEILILTTEPWKTYSRPLISYWLQGKVERENMHYRHESFYRDNNCQVRYETEVVRIDNDRKVLELKDRERIFYQKLLVATGSIPFVPALKGLPENLNQANIFTFTSLQDVINIRAKLNKDSQVVILGAGLIGLKAAEAMVFQSKQVTVVDLANRVLPSVLDRKSGAIVEKHLKDQGINFILETSIEEIKDKTLSLSNKDELKYDILIMAVGTRPQSYLIEEAGGLSNRGIITDNKQLTTLADVYAAGDCTISYDITSDTYKNMAILPNAFMQGEVSGINMAGGDALYENAFPLNSLGLMGLYVMTAGNYEGEIYEIETKDYYQKIFVEDNHLNGYIIIGDSLRSGIYTDLIRLKTELSTLDWERLKTNPQLMAFKKEIRREKLSLGH